MRALPTDTLIDLRQLAEQAALAAGRYIQSRFDTSVTSRHKRGGDTLASQVLTEVDERAQEIILDHLSTSIAAYDFGLLTEESTDDQSRLVKDYFWCIDPLDGTLPFTEKRSGYAVSIALVSKEGDPVVSAVHVPDTDESYTAHQGGGVFYNHTPFNRTIDTERIHLYMDRSLRSAEYFETAHELLVDWAESNHLSLEIHDDFGGVRNALGVLQAGRGVYFKLPKDSPGCGSIWDYAATRLFFEEVKMPVTNAMGNRLALNDPATTFMNSQGIVYATDTELSELVRQLYHNRL